MADKFFKLDLVTPRKVVFSGSAISVSVPGVAGGFQVLYNHAPILAAIGVGEVKLTDSNGAAHRFATSGGFIDVLNNRVIVLAETLERSDEIDVERAGAARDRARSGLLKKVAANQAAELKAAIDRANNRLRIARKQ